MKRLVGAGTAAALTVAVAIATFAAEQTAAAKRGRWTVCSTPSVGLSNLASDGDIAIGVPPSAGVVWTP